MNVEVVARIRPPRRGEISNIRVSGTRVQSSRGTGHIFNSVYSQKSLTYDVYKDCCEPLVELLCAGYNTSLLLLGETGSGKSFSLAGDKTAKAGLIPLLINGVFMKVRDQAREQNRTHLTATSSSQVVVQCCEFYNEQVTDLLLSPTEAQRVEIAESATSGVYLKNATKRRVADAAECTAVFREAWAARAHSYTDYGQSDSRTTFLFTLDLSMSLRDNSAPFTSRLSVIELPGAEKLAEDPTQLRMREGVSLNKSVLAFGQLVATLASTHDAARNINYNESILTSLLHDTLGGNCKTKVLVTLKSMDSSVLNTVLMIAGQLAQVVNYPIINDSLAMGLITYYRRIIHQLKEELKSGGFKSGGSSSNFQELKDQLARLANENVELQEGREQLHRRVLDLEAKYTEATNSWKQLSSKLEISDEEKLQVYKNLVDLQLENNRIIEEAEADKYELTNRILSLENQVHELDAELGKERRSGGQAAQALQLLQQDHQDLREEYMTLKTNHIKVSNDYQREVTRNEELAVELVSLSNIKDRLQRDREDVEFEKMQEYYSQLRKLASKFSRGSIQEKNDLSKSVVSLRSENLNLEKQLMMSSKDKEGRLNLLRNEHQQELDRLDGRISKLKVDLQESKSAHRETQQKVAAQAAEVITAKAEQKRLQEENNRLDQQLKEISAEYSNRLQQYVHDISVYCGQSSGQQFSLESLNAYIDAMVRKIRDAQEQRVVQLEGRVRELKGSITDLLNKHQQVLSAYSVLRFTALGSEQDRARLLSSDEYDAFLPSGEELQTAQAREIGILTRKLHEYENTITELRRKPVKDENSLKLAQELTQHKQEYHHDKGPTIASVEMGWGSLRKQLREFTLNTQLRTSA
ncbi:coiled-coil domain-containing protein 78 isoform X2 [Nematostella vectensis]|uniref:coiled-coil domain-containing protein 78 isoform X2 n=1 Tax=Nematostella vectensis TaxID=45351 RepID=UPI00207704C7|nr:coiled-coil domain-containing protein 78 isoform X2 [Nematostella vectensis]